MALNPSNSINLEQLALKGLIILGIDNLKKYSGYPQYWTNTDIWKYFSDIQNKWSIPDTQNEHFISEIKYFTFDIQNAYFG